DQCRDRRRCRWNYAISQFRRDAKRQCGRRGTRLASERRCPSTHNAAMNIRRESLAGTIQTVLGAIAPKDLGATLMHEHVICNNTPPALRDLPSSPPITMRNRFDIDYGRK